MKKTLAFCQFLALQAGLFAQPESKPATSSFAVKWIGEMRQVMREGDLSGRVPLHEIASQRHVYAVGPIEGLRGEVTVLDGKSYLSRIEKGVPVVETSFARRACFLVYAQVERFVEVALPEGIKGGPDLEDFIGKAASKERLDIREPFPFLLKGRPKTVDYHIVNKTDPAPHTPADHEKVKVKARLTDAPMTIIGFWSKSHHGIFTHHGTNVHMHLVTDDKQVAGHVDALDPASGMVLSIPVH
jgi:acetolactate decarboxylase